MLDPRIYRAAFLPAVAAFVALMFSLEPEPRELDATATPPAFDGGLAARTARSIVELAPERRPGSSGSDAVADLVAERFAAVEGGVVAEQTVDASFEGERVELRNLILTLPGESDQVLLVVAHRDSARGIGAASSAAATAMLLSLAADLGGARREMRIVLASTDGGSDGALGARELIDVLDAPEGIGAAVVITQPGVASPEPPFAVATSLGPRSPSPQLVETARSIAEARFQRAQARPGPWAGLSRLAFPIGLGEQAALDEQGIPSIAVSSAGERPLEPEADRPDSLSAETLAAAGAATAGLIVALDEAGAELAPAPAAYLRLGDSLIPGWTLSLLALTLLLPALIAAADTWLRELRRERRGRRALPWAFELAVIPLAALLLAYLLALIGVIPSPRYPYDPGRFGPGLEMPVTAVLLTGALVAAGMVVRPLRTPFEVGPPTLAAGAGLLLGGSLLVIWLLNPYLALLLSPAAHVWLPIARAAGPPRPAMVAAVAVASLLPALLAGRSVASELDLGLEAPWHLLLLIVSGQLSPGISVAACGLLAGLLACVAAAGAAAPARSRSAVAVHGRG